MLEPSSGKIGHNKVALSSAMQTVLRLQDNSFQRSYQNVFQKQHLQMATTGLTVLELAEPQTWLCKVYQMIQLWHLEDGIQIALNATSGFS